MDWQSYRLEDFVPFTAEVYLRLIERVNEDYWPLHGLTIALGVAALLLALRGYRRLSIAVLAPAWISSAVIFHFGYNAELNWAAPWFGWIFVVEAVLLLVMAAAPAPPRGRRSQCRPRTLIAAGLAVLGTILYPLVAVAAGTGWRHAEVFGLHPDPTAIATLGVVVLAHRGKALACLVPLPAAACLLATLTLIPLELAWALLPLSAVAACILALALDAVARRRGLPGRVD